MTWRVIEGFAPVSARRKVTPELARECGAALTRAEGKWIANDETSPSRATARVRGNAMRDALYRDGVLSRARHGLRVSTQRVEGRGVAAPEAWRYLLQLTVGPRPGSQG